MAPCIPISLKPHEEYSMAQNFTISGNKLKGYQAVADGTGRVHFVGATQEEVIDQTRRYMRQHGGGELRIQRADGTAQYRDADTVPPAARIALKCTIPLPRAEVLLYQEKIIVT